MRTRASLAALLLTAAGLMANVPRTEAQDKDAVTEVARRRFQEGVKFFDQKRYEEARAAFLQAYALKHHPAVLLNLAQSEIRSGHPLEAARHFSAYLRESPSASGTERGDAEKGLAAARSKLAKISVSTVAGAEILVDGESAGQAPLNEPVDVMPGTHNVEAKLGSRTASTTITVPTGRSANASLSLEGAPPAVAAAPAPPPAAPVPPTTPPPATLPPPEPSETKPASELPKDATASGEAGAQASTEGRESFFVWLGHNGVGIAGLGITAIGIGVGAGFTVAANQASENSDAVAGQIKRHAQDIGIADSTGTCVDPYGKVNGSPRTDLNKPVEIQNFVQACSLLSEDLDKRKQDRLFATGGFVLAGVGLAATFTAYFLTSGRTTPTTARAVVVPVVGSVQRGLAIVGTF